MPCSAQLRLDLVANGAMEPMDLIIRVLSRTLERVWSEFILGEDIASIFLAFGLLAIAIMTVCWGGYFLWKKGIDPMLENRMDPSLKKISERLKQ
jgi:hypothetical protein